MGRVSEAEAIERHEARHNLIGNADVVVERGAKSGRSGMNLALSFRVDQGMGRAPVTYTAKTYVMMVASTVTAISREPSINIEVSLRCEGDPATRK